MTTNPMATTLALEDEVAGILSSGNMLETKSPGSRPRLFFSISIISKCRE